MDSKKAIRLLHSQVFEADKINIIEKLALNPERYLGDFRPTKPRAKIIQNLLQSHEIRFGDAIELLLREILAEQGYTNLDLVLNIDDKTSLSLDQYFAKGKKHFFIEQKMRDDHDSTKKRGQIKNFEEKLDRLYQEHHKNLIGIMYFVDPAFSKSKSFYQEQLDKLKDIYGLDLYLFYGKDLFTYLSFPTVWFEFVSWLTDWRRELDDFPEIDLDASPRESFEDIKSIRLHYWRKLISNEQIWADGIIRVLFSEGTTLMLLFGHFSKQKSDEYQNLAKSLLERIDRYY